MIDAPKEDLRRVMLAHGGGGELTSRLIAEHFLPHLKNATLSSLTDGAVLPWDSKRVVFTTDSYVVTPLEFPGGDIGKLAVAGTVNDLSVLGAEPVALSLGVIIEEGLPLDVLDRVVASIAATAKEAGVQIVTGDTKVIERRTGEGLFINTAGVGRLAEDVNLDVNQVVAGDAIIVNGTLADHGLTIMSVRGGIEFDSDLRSDAAPLNGLIQAVLRSGAKVRFIRDATRGGLAGVVADVSEHCGLSIDLDEAAIPLTLTARHAAEMLGLDPVTVANEGKIVLIVAAEDAKSALNVMRAQKYGKDAAVIGYVTRATPPLVELVTRAGGRRVVQRPYGEELPRIC